MPRNPNKRRSYRSLSAREKAMVLEALGIPVRTLSDMENRERELRHSVSEGEYEREMVRKASNARTPSSD